MWFIALDGSRPSGFGMSPITYCEMAAFFELTDAQPEWWEVDLIKAFDKIAMEQQPREK